MDLDGKVALITGAASGIGHAIAKRYLEAGGRVAIADLNEEGAVEAAKELAGQNAAIGVGMDVSNEDQVNKGVARAAEAFDRIDILVSNAGIQIVHPIEDFPFADWKKMLAIHLDGAFLTTKACLPHMYQSGRGGSVIYMGSVHSKEASLLKAPYATAKHGLIGLCKVVAKEGAKHEVRANVICPGFVRTPLVENQVADQAKAHGVSEDEVLEQVILAPHAVKRLIEPDEVADVVAFLLGPRGRAFTGVPVTMDLGWSAR
jgi:3-hydroxybutyrate dehydrogenase